MNNNNWLIFLCIITIFITACTKDDTTRIIDLGAKCAEGNEKACKKLGDIALNDLNSDFRKVAVERLADQTILTDIARKGKDRNVRKAAINKLSDQAVLADIARNDPQWYIREAAINKLIDQSVLGDIARNDSKWNIREAAFRKISDRTELAKIIWENNSNTHIALKKLSFQDMQIEETLNEKDWKLRLILKFIKAFDTVPTENRLRLMLGVLPALLILSRQEIVSAVGDILSIKTSWSEIPSPFYVFKGSSEPFKMRGEKFSCSIKVQKISEPLSFTWETVFPMTTKSLGFKFAYINPADLLRKPFNIISDQKLLTDIARNNPDSGIREVAAKRLPKENRLRSVILATSFEIYDLTDQVVLAEIAKIGANDEARLAAVRNLTNQAALTYIAKNDPEVSVRKAAEERLKELKNN